MPDYHVIYQRRIPRNGRVVFRTAGGKQKSTGKGDLVTDGKGLGGGGRVRNPTLQIPKQLKRSSKNW